MDSGRNLGMHSKSPGGRSAFSGTTARTSRSAQDLTALSSEDMIEVFEDLSRYSDKMLDFLIPSELSETTIAKLMVQLRTKGSQANKKLHRLQKMFSEQRDVYASDSYIVCQEVLATLFSKKSATEVEMGQWRPDALLQKANLAVLVSSVLSYSWQDREMEFLEELEQTFPTPFASKLVSSDENLQIGDSALQVATFQLALELRTQLAITLLGRSAEQPSFDSNLIFLQVFYEDANSNALRGWNIQGLQSGDLTREHQKTILSQIQKLTGFFASPEENPPLSVELLETAFPRIAVITQAVKWTSQRLGELNDQIRANGGFNEVFHAFRNEVQRPTLNGRSYEGVVSNDDSPEIQLQYDTPSEITNEASEVQDRRKSARTKILKQGQFKWVLLYYSIKLVHL